MGNDTYFHIIVCPRVETLVVVGTLTSVLSPCESDSEPLGKICSMCLMTTYHVRLPQTACFICKTLSGGQLRNGV